MHTDTPTLQCVFTHSSLRSHIHTERDDNISMVTALMSFSLSDVLPPLD